MKAGVSTKDITPPLRTRLSDQARYNTGVHDPLFAKALVLDDGENAVAIVCLDLCIADVEFCDELRERIRERTGIEYALINFSHTHSAPLLGIGFTEGNDEPHEIKWTEGINQSIPEAVEEAYANRIPVSLNAGRAPAQVGFNRRRTDWIRFLLIRDLRAATRMPGLHTLLPPLRKLTAQLFRSIRLPDGFSRPNGCVYSLPTRARFLAPPESAHEPRGKT